MGAVTNDTEATVQAHAARALVDCGGDKDAALLLLAHLLVNALRGSSAGMLRLPPRL